MQKTSPVTLEEGNNHGERQRTSDVEVVRLVHRQAKWVVQIGTGGCEPVADGRHRAGTPHGGAARGPRGAATADSSRVARACRAAHHRRHRQRAAGDHLDARAVLVRDVHIVATVDSDATCVIQRGRGRCAPLTRGPGVAGAGEVRSGARTSYHETNVVHISNVHVTRRIKRDLYDKGDTGGGYKGLRR